MTMRNLYLVLALLGAALPLSQFLPWVAEHGLNFPLFFHELFINRISSFFAMDVIVSAVVLITWILHSKTRHGWVAIAGTLLIGVSLGLPLHLYLRSKFTV
jgi:hypothetical protein